MNKLNVGIVGGSIAGCSAAILLCREGHQVQVYERSHSELVGRGGGIGTSGAVFESLIEENVIDADIPHLSCSAMPFIIRTPGEERFGYSPWQMPIDFKVFHWGALWNNLRKRVPDEIYHQGHEVVNAKSNGTEAATLQFKDGSDIDFDLVLFADGYQSLGRQLLFPESKLNYRGYMLWRGLLPEKEMADIDPLGSNLPRFSYPNLPGNFVVYFVPAQDGNMQEGNRLFNWAAYIPISEAEVAKIMIDREGVAHSGSLPPGRMKPEDQDLLKHLMYNNLPTYYGELVSKTQNTYVQLIYTARLPAYHYGRIGLIGDAGMVVQPFTASGIFKGHSNVKDLLHALNSHGTVEDGLQHWGQEQVRIGNRLLALGEQEEQAFIWNTLNLATADAASTAAWWKSAVTFPEEFSFETNEK